ncbi:hypothetical protein ACHAP4_004379 [Fusarium culmorum]
MANPFLLSEYTVYKRRLLRRMKWIEMTYRPFSVHELYLDPEGLPRRHGMPPEREEFLPINTTIEQLAQAVHQPIIEQGLMVGDHHAIIVPLFALQPVLRNRHPLTHDNWAFILQRLDEFLAEPRREDRRRIRHLYPIFCLIMEAREQCKLQLALLTAISSQPEETRGVFDHLDLMIILNKVLGLGERGINDSNFVTHRNAYAEIWRLNEHSRAFTSPEFVIDQVGRVCVRNILLLQQNDILLRMVDDVI